MYLMDFKISYFIKIYGFILKYNGKLRIRLELSPVHF